MKVRRSLALVALALAAASAHSQQPAEGELDKFMNRDAKDVATRLELITQTLYEQQQQIITILFRQEHGERVKMKEIWFPTPDKQLVPAQIFTPLKMDAGKRYPAIVMVHGGFHDHFNPAWFNKVATAVANGYVVIFPEYRGSRGYGAEIYRNDYGVTDTADVISATRYFAAQPFVDPERLGIFGQSRGGMVTLLVIEKEPKLFKAAVDLVGLTDFVAFMAYKPEWRRQETVRENPSFKGKGPDENLPAYMDISPVLHVDKIQTPLFVVATTGDKIAPYQLHTGHLLDALKAKGKVHESKIYENAAGGHIFTNSDSDESRDALKRIFEFIGKYLKP